MKLGKILLLFVSLCVSAMPSMRMASILPLYAAPLKNTWPTFNGDYSGRRYSELAQINAENVKTLGPGMDDAREYG